MKSIFKPIEITMSPVWNSCHTSPYIQKKWKKANINNGFVYGGELGRLLGRTPCKWWQIAGGSYKYTVEEISTLIRDNIIPIFDKFEASEKNIEDILMDLK